MNSDPYDSAAWRTFGMLDADESQIFAEAMRHDPVLQSACLEIDRIAAAIAAATAAPVPPALGELDQIQSRLGLRTARRNHFWLAVSGWAAALALGGVLLFQQLRSSPPPAAASAPPPAAAESTAPAEPLQPQLRKTTAKIETKRLTQEIEVLRDNLEKYQRRDRVLFEAVPGMALPIVMTMNPPGIGPDDSPAPAKNDEDSPITSMLGDAVRALTRSGNPPADAAPLPEHPTAIPIYDAARDSGTLVVSNLPAAAENESYNLWVTTVTGGQPVFVGSLPESSAAGADSFDFSLGSTMVLPSGFLLTLDPQGAPASPGEANTILRGPPAASR